MELVLQEINTSLQGHAAETCTFKGNETMSEIDSSNVRDPCLHEQKLPEEPGKQKVPPQFRKVNMAQTRSAADLPDCLSG